jgi:YD repeat-containing protein
VTDEISGLATYIDSTSAAHQLVKTVDRNNNAITYGYTSGQLTSITGAGGRALTISYVSTPGSGACVSTFNSTTVASCMVVTDPVGRTETFLLSATGSSGRDLLGVTLTPAAGAGSSATYAFSYSGHFLTSWWDPQNWATFGSSTTEATDVAYLSATNYVSQVTGPQVANQGTDMTDTYTPTWTYTYPNGDVLTGNGTVVVADANANWNAAHPSQILPGANVTMDQYVDWGLASQVQGFGPAENSYSLVQTSEQATLLRDPLTLLPDETIDPRADTGTGTLFDSGVTFYTHDALGNVLATTTPGPTAGTWASTTSTFNAENEPLSGVDARGNPTTYTYDAKGNLLTTTSPATNGWTVAPVTSNFYSSTGELCASRDAIEVASYGTLTSCAASHASTDTYNSYGDLTATTSPLDAVSQSAFDPNGNACATLTPDGYASVSRAAPARPNPTRT